MTSPQGNKTPNQFEMVDEFGTYFQSYESLIVFKRNDGKVFPERFATRNEAQTDLNHKLGNGATYGLAWIIEIL